MCDGVLISHLFLKEFLFLVRLATPRQDDSRGRDPLRGFWLVVPPAGMGFQIPLNRLAF